MIDSIDKQAHLDIFDLDRIKQIPSFDARMKALRRAFWISQAAVLSSFDPDYIKKCDFATEKEVANFKENLRSTAIKRKQRERAKKEGIGGVREAHMALGFLTAYDSQQ
ncbi:hypothetical protein N0V85_006203 [Neurospora sp. IMI 360204]|nr:hypothetical protein N0V85_006203 [Neurospora sp. IMI 360204]